MRCCLLTLASPYLLLISEPNYLVIHWGKMKILISWKSLTRDLFQKKILGFMHSQSWELPQFWICHENLAAGVTGSLCLVAAGAPKYWFGIHLCMAGNVLGYRDCSRRELTGNWEITRTRTRIFQVKLKTLLTARAALWSDLWFKQQHPAECRHLGALVKWINAPQTPHFSRELQEMQGE